MMNGGVCKRSHCVWCKTGKILLVVGGLNWGLVGVAMLLGNDANWNVVNLLLGSWPMSEAVVYVLVGVAAVMRVFHCKCSKCSNCTCVAEGDTSMGAKMGGSM